MLDKAKVLRGYTLHGRDGEMGNVEDFFFDDRCWSIRYLVADTGTWLADRKVLISPHALLSVDPERDFITVALTKKQIEASPAWDSSSPVSRQFEYEYCGYFDWPAYWEGGKAGDLRLRSVAASTGCHIHASDGEIGHVDDFVIDDATWTIRYVIVDTRNWLTGRKVLIAPTWITGVSWDESKVFLELSKDAVKRSPEYDADSPPSRDYEIGLHRHYDRPGYWG